VERARIWYSPVSVCLKMSPISKFRRKACLCRL
jgi:hypothetical protein